MVGAYDGVFDNGGEQLTLLRPDSPPPSEPDAVRFFLLGPDGAPLGSSVTLVTGMRWISDCAVAAAGRDTYVVLWWRIFSDDFYTYSIYATSVRVRR